MKKLLRFLKITYKIVKILRATISAFADIVDIVSDIF